MKKRKGKQKMEKIFEINKRGITVILTLCILLGIVGTCGNITAIAAETTVETEATAVATEEITTVVVEETAQELVPMMARGCGTTNDPLTKYFGSGYTVTSTSGPWHYISGAGGITGAYNISTGYGYVQMSDGTRSSFQI
jgi:hypothetical protein